MKQLANRYQTLTTAKLVPFEEKRPDIFGYMKGTITILGDIVGPTGGTWDSDT